ncbi:hypothetical protein ACERNI_13665 [Camelimonas sp. ID_303_24]
MNLVRRLACVAGGAAILTLAAATVADATPRERTTVILQVDVPGRAGANRHRLALTVRAPDGREVMLALSCGVSDPAVFGAALDLGGAAPPIEGRAVTLRLENPDGQLNERLASTDRFLILGGERAVRLFARALRSEVINLDDGAGKGVRFGLAAERPRVDRFRALCRLE